MKLFRARDRMGLRLRVAARQLGRLAAREIPIIRRKIAPWWGSITFHALLLIVILLFVLAPSGGNGLGPGAPHESLVGQLTEDVTSLEERDRAGDPFTRLDDENISAPVDPTELDPSLLNVPDLPDTLRFVDQIERGAALDLGEFAPDPKAVSPLEQLLGSEAVAGISSRARSSPFVGRHPQARAALLRREGGTKESEAAVERGLDWIARHQAPDGHWGLDPHPFCAPQAPCPEGRAMRSDVAATGMALLPILGAGHTHTKKGRYQATLTRGLNWLLAVQQPTGELFTGGESNGRMYSHAIGAMALCEAYGLSGDRRLLRPAQQAVDFIRAAQGTGDGGWRYQPGAPGDTSVFGWQMMCLRSASLAGIKMGLGTIRGAKNYLNLAAADPAGATYSYMPGHGPNLVMTAEALLCRQYLGAKRTAPFMLSGAGLVYEDLMSSDDVNIYYWYYATQLLHNMGGKNWSRWNTRVRDFLVDSQARNKACDNGSWDPLSPQEDRWGRRAGRHYQTCLSVMTLEVYYRYLPVYRTDPRSMDPSSDPGPDGFGPDRPTSPAGPLVDASGGFGPEGRAAPSSSDPPAAGPPANVPATSAPRP